jgi:hypothetical protein
MNTIQPEVVMPRWAEVADSTLAQHRNLSQEKRQVSLEDANWDLVHWESKKRFSPMGEEKWEFLLMKDETAGSTCRWCPDPHTDGYREFFPTRCNDCNTLNSYRYRGRQAALKLLSIKYSLDLESILWTFTFPLVSSNRPLEDHEIRSIAKDRRLYISQNLLRDKNIWHDKFVGINVMECEVTEPGETRNARFWKDDYERTSNMWTYHIHGHYLILSPKDSKVNLDLAYEKFGHNQNKQQEMVANKQRNNNSHNDDDTHDTNSDPCVVKMRLFYKHERDYDRRKLDSRGETIGTRDEMKIMRDYLVGYARKDCLGKLAWNGDTTWRKIRTKIDNVYLDINGNEIDVD